MSNNSPVIVGLGNPGAKYDGTRHNIGFAVVDFLLQCSGLREIAEIGDKPVSLAERAISGTFDYSGWSDEGSYMVAPFRIATVTGFLLKPRTFMNRSGEPLQSFLSFRKIPLENVVVAHDEIDIPVGALRVKVGGGEGGHNGLRSIASSCGGKGFGRLRCGVGKPPPGNPAFSGEEGIARWVLSRYNNDEKGIVEGMVLRAAEAALSLVTEGLSETQNRFNR
jgi:PTH1 family peptidyl-tRNA hydrolase